MVKAYVLIGVEGRDTKRVGEELTKISEVEKVNEIYGEYDLIAIVKTENLIDLREVAMDKISKVKGVISTSSLIVADEE